MNRILGILALSALTTACTVPSSEVGETVSGQPNSGSNTSLEKQAQLQAHWNEDVSGNVTQAYCIVCHSDSSIAKDTDWVILENNQDDYLSTNLSRTLAYMDADENNAQKLLDKAQGVNHGGGAVIQDGTTASDHWVDFIELAQTSETDSLNPDSGNSDGSNPSLSRQAAIDFYTDNLENDLIQGDCYVCHQADGVAKNSDLIFIANNVNDYETFNANSAINYAQLSARNFNNFLLKPIGQGHGGNQIIEITSVHAQNISSFLTLVENIVDTPESSVTAPSNAQASVLLGEVFFVWEMSGDHDGFEVQRKEENGEWQNIATLTENSNLYRDTSVESKNYQYRVRATLEQDNSNYSSAVSVSID